MKNSQKLKELYEKSKFTKIYFSVDSLDQSDAAKMREFLEGDIEADDQIEEWSEGLIGVMYHLIGLQDGTVEPEYTF